MAADDAQQLQLISDNIESMYQSLRLAASNISGLLQLGNATCDEVRAYNLWALACYNTQRGMLATLRANGEQNVPELPTAPTLFTWRGVDGSQALNIDCSGEESDLSGLMSRALRGPGKASVYLSTNEIAIQTTDAFALQPENSPTFATLLQIQQSRQVQGLGAIGILIAIAGIAIAVSIAIVAIMSYLKSSSIQEENSRQVKLQADAFANYTATRLNCLQSCTQQGGTTQACVDQCRKLVDKPNIQLPDNPFDQSWGVLQWTGFTVLLGGVGYIAWRIWERRKAGKPIFELPSFEHHEHHNSAE